MAKKNAAPTKSEILAQISKDTGLAKKQVSDVFVFDTELVVGDRLRVLRLRLMGACLTGDSSESSCFEPRVRHRASRFDVDV